MGRLSRGFLGGFQGQLGTAYGCFWRLMDLVKAMPRKVKRAPTEAQLPARLKLSLMTSFLARLSSIINVGFKYVKTPGQSAMNAAVSYNLNNAITGTSPDFSIDFPKLMFSKGRLPLPPGITATAGAGSVIEFEWKEPIPGTPNGSPNDKVTFIVYNQQTQQLVVLDGAIKRSQLEFELMLPPPFVGDTVHCFITFVGTDGKSVSDSVYITETIVV